MVDLSELDRYLQALLLQNPINDYCPNGLQIEGSSQVSCIVSGVTASQALIDAAVAHQADLLLVHHGYFWKGESPCLVGIKGRRIALLYRHQISLIAYHLPLDVHPVYGNNIKLAEHLEIHVEGAMSGGGVEGLIWYGTLSSPMTGTAFSELLSERLKRVPLHIPGNENKISRIAWCTGSAQHYIQCLDGLHVDAYISGEISENTVHYAREAGIQYFAAGHHATERYGVQALGEHLSSRFGIAHQFVDIDNPV